MPPKRNQDKGMVNRLRDQLKVQKQVNRIHKDPRLLKEIAFYPEHDKRRETKEYKTVHKKLTQELDLPCLICGIRNSTLKDKQKNSYGARQMETHHHIIEWALDNAVSVEKFNSALLPNLRHRHPGNPQYEKEFTQEDIRNWVDHSQDNLWVLCDVHHRAKYFGIHEITDPIWGPQGLLRDDFEEYVRKEIAAVESKERPKKRKG
jgi:hypothetical protein